MDIETTNTQGGKNITPLKFGTTGLEIESHIITLEGDIDYSAMELIEDVKNKHPTVEIVKECGKNIIEFGCYPDFNTYNPALEMIDSLEKTFQVAEKKGLSLYPFGTYPGKMETRFTPDTSGKYPIQEKIFGKEKFSLSTKVVGFHHHYSLPKSVFDPEKKQLKLLIDGKLKRSLLNCYNFEIAIDPILTLLTQSSPFFEGELLGKNSRILVYRGGKKLKYLGLYNNHQMFGGLPPYKQTETDLLYSMKRKQIKWKQLVKKADPETNFNEMYPYKLDIAWNPVKINKHGTLEHRGMDANFMSILLGVSALIKFSLKKIQEDYVEVIPSDVGIKEPFKIKKGMIFVPPHTYVRAMLQKASAYEGFDNEELLEYTKKFYRFAKKLTPKIYHPLINKIGQMIKWKKSTSDKIIIYARKKRLINEDNTLINGAEKLIAKKFSEQYRKDLIETKKIVEEISRKHKIILEIKKTDI